MLRPAPIALASLATLLSACTGANPPSLPSIADLTGSITEAPIVGQPTEVYERIARGALACWFGASGPLKANYLYHAEADPPGRGGKAEIVIHERNRGADNPKGERAYRIAIAPENEATALTFENVKMPEATAAAMEKDARRWGTGEIGCTHADAGGWSENTPPLSPALANGKAKSAPKPPSH
jgi:hypothetical protein